ncbi:MAG: ssDNA-binding domain-containing protein [Lachnospiraceae bacterium]|nr:ssDNA-binding domain-containing protein [Lachnospiraceae bacterium]
MANNVYQIVTDRIIEELEKGNIPWQKPWTGVRTGAFNRISKKPYSILNQMLLKHRGEYATFKQWSELGGHIRKGEKSEVVVFWNMKKYEEEDENGEKVEKVVPLLRYYNVFHISQVDGVEPLKEELHEVEPIEEADRIINEYISREGITFNECKSNQAYYSPMQDMVVVPMKAQFQNIEEYYSTTFHELTHSTGHKNRLDRFTDGRAAAFGSETYSKEELVAEIGSANILNRLGIETEKSFRNSAAYIQSWLKVLKDDNKFIVSAASKAEKAVEYIIQ